MGASTNKRPTLELVKLLKDKLASRGARGIIGLGKSFRIMDDDNSKCLSTYEFNKALHDYGLEFTKDESEDIFEFFDTDRSGTVDYNEFLRAIRGPMNKKREQKVMQAFAKLDKDGSGWIDINDLRGVYTADKHPDVIQGKKTEDDILNEFLETFEVAHSIREQATPDHVVTKEEFIEYYNCISSSIDDDNYFVLMMDNAWKLTEESRMGMGTKGWNSNQSRNPRAKGNNDIFGRNAASTRAAQPNGLNSAASERQVIEHVQKQIA